MVSSQIVQSRAIVRTYTSRCPRKRPGLPGVQYVGIPQFQDVGNQCTQQFSAVIAGRSSVDAAIKNCQDVASQVGQ
jgi:sorbitol/mannitol transport system substrate-binding protein